MPARDLVGQSAGRNSLSRQMLDSVGARLRPHRLLPFNKELLGKFPKELGESEFNVGFGMGTATNAAAGTANYTQNAPRDLILRRLFVSSGNTAGRITTFQVGGENIIVGSTFPVAAFGPTAVESPEFDFYAKAGCPVQLSIAFDAAFTSDVGFAID
jgi:hypothetical protein